MKTKPHMGLLRYDKGAAGGFHKNGKRWKTAAERVEDLYRTVQYNGAMPVDRAAPMFKRCVRMLQAHANATLARHKSKHWCIRY